MSEYVVEIDDYPAITIDGFNVRAEVTLAQREKVVRCWNCNYFVSTCTYDYCDYFKRTLKSPNGFCAWGRCE